MISIFPDNVSDLLRRYSFEVDSDSVNEDVICQKCRMLVKDAYQTYCGCTYCYKCISEHILEGGQYCCGNKGDCKDHFLILDENVNKSIFLNKKILRVKVICPNESCLYSGYLQDMDGHIRRCSKQSAECPFGVIGCSDESLTKETIEDHINDKNVAHMRLLKDWVDQFKNESKSEIESLNSNLKSLREEHDREITLVKEDSMNKEIRIKKEIESLKEAQKREIESLKSNLKSLREEHDKEITIVKEDSVNKETRIKKEIESLKEAHKKEIESLKEAQRNGNESLKSLREGHDKEITIVKEDSSNKETRIKKEIESLKEAQKREIESLKEAQRKGNDSLKRDTESKMNKLSQTIDDIKERTIMSGVTIFPIYGIDNRMKIAEEEILSPYFYSHNNGYKVRLAVYPGGHLGGSGTHLSVYINICKGEYDDLLPWPCKYSFHVSLVNQRSGATHNTKTFSHNIDSDNGKYCYDKPNSGDNRGRGYSMFISHSDLRTIDGLIMNDRINIKCIVTAP